MQVRGFVKTFKHILMNLLLLVPILYGLLGMLGIILAATQCPHVFKVLDDTGQQLDQATITLDDTTQGLDQARATLSQDFNVPLPMQNFNANFRDMADNLRRTAASVNNICAGKILGVCVYTVHMDEASRSLYAVADNIGNIPNTIPSTITVENPMKSQASKISGITNSISTIKSTITMIRDSIPTIKNAIIGILIYKFLEHLSFFSIGLYLFLQGSKNKR